MMWCLFNLPPFLIILLSNCWQFGPWSVKISENSDSKTLLMNHWLFSVISRLQCLFFLLAWITRNHDKLLLKITLNSHVKLWVNIYLSFKFYFSVIVLQCGVSFCCTIRWSSYNTSNSMCSFLSDSVNSRTVAHQASLFMGFSRQEYCSGFPFPSPRDLPHPGIEPMSLASPALAGRFFTTELPGKPQISYLFIYIPSF